MRHLKTELIYAAGALVSGLVLGYIEYPDSLFACLSVVIAAEVIGSMLRMCDRLLDPPPTIFLLISGQWSSVSRLHCHPSGLTISRRENKLSG